MDADAEFATATTSEGSATKRFFLHTLDQLVKDNIITGYTRVKLAGLMTSDGKKDYAKAKKHIIDIMGLHDTFLDDGKESAPPSACPQQQQQQQQQAKATKGRINKHQFPPEWRP